MELEMFEIRRMGTAIMLTESTARQASSSAPRRMAALFGLLFAMLAAPAVAAAQESTSTAGAAGSPPPGIFIYAISREGEPVGQQRLEFVDDGKKLRVIGHTEINVTFLGMTLYGFTQQVEEVRVAGKIVALNSEADDDGTDTKVALTLQGDRLKGRYNGKQAREIDPTLITSLFWQRPPVGPGQVLDTVRGKVRDVTVTDLGNTTLDLPVGRVSAHHYRVAGELKRELWYDAQGILVAGELAAKDGSAVRQELQQRP